MSFEVTTARKVTDFSTQLQKKLALDLSLSVEADETISSDGHVNSVTLRSTAPLRDSKILTGGWRESFNFDVSLHAAADGKVRIRGATQPLVCRQALGNVRDFHGLDEAQRSLYASALDGFVEAAISSTCTSFRKIDASRVTCD